MFITASDFNVLPYLLPSLKSGVAEEFLSFIESEQELFLREVLGDNLYDAFIIGLEDITDYDPTVSTVIGDQYAYGNNVWEALTETTGVTPIAGSDWTLIDTDNRWLLLKNGSTYLMNGKYYRWAGMVKALKALIFSRWIEYTASQITVNGFVTPKTENNYTVDPGTMICRAWNDWASKVGNVCHSENTLYGYLYYSGTTFDDIPDSGFDSFATYLSYEFGEQGTRNTFGI